ncbi:hypothetical protein, partial [Mesorhizobium sp. M1A.F.Ca.IN.020.32.1.1]|uniref:hypothetical protein n=1 Tax=Mesorhizobium sp. M1A.F.Ca.IN.020.32.1.1 TaxID=2496763 RepID=UPI001FE1E3CE
MNPAFTRWMRRRAPSVVVAMMSSPIPDEEGIAELQRKDWDFAAVTASATGSTLVISSSVLPQMAPAAVAL